MASEQKWVHLFINNLNSQSTSPILISDITVNNSDIIEVNAEEVEDLDIFDIRENFDSKCREFNELMNNLSIQQNEFNDRMPKHVEQLNAVGATKNMKKIRIAIMAVANDMDDIATLYDESAPKIITIFGEIIVGELNSNNMTSEIIMNRLKQRIERHYIR